MDAKGREGIDDEMDGNGDDCILFSEVVGVD